MTEENVRTLQWIEQCEENFKIRLNHLAESVLGQSNLKIICMTGPTCSGKTTAADLLVRRLKCAGKTVHLVSVDDFYYDKSLLHRNVGEGSDGTVDYDSIKTVNLSAIKRFIAEFSTGTVCRCPIYDFRLGQCTGYRTISCREDDIFIFEGIQILYPEIGDLLKGYVSCGIYIVPQSSVEIAGRIFEPNEIRLLRRLVRDYNFRNTMPQDTFLMWNGVRSNEEKNIFPYVRRDFLRLDSIVPYEIGVLKPYLLKILPTVPKNSRYRKQSEEILDKLQPIPSISAQLIPTDSLYREFV